MIAKKISFSMIFGQTLPGFAMDPRSIAYYTGCRPEEPKAPEGGPGPEAPTGGPGPEDKIPGGAMPTQDFELTLLGDGKGILKSEHGCQKVDDIVESEFSISFSAFSGSEGVEVFRYTLMFSDSTAQIVGFCCGIKPFFRSFMPLRGEIIEA
jgi:hypothetical protein